MPSEKMTMAAGPVQWVLMAVGAASAAIPFGTLLWVLWDRVRPLFIPQSEIDRAAESYLAQFGDRAIEKLAIDADRAERYGNLTEAGCLLRIIKAIERQRSTPVPLPEQNPST